MPEEEPKTPEGGETPEGTPEGTPPEGTPPEGGEKPPEGGEAPEGGGNPDPNQPFPGK